MQVFGHSPDETAYFRHLLDRETVQNCLIMIQPQLIAYTLHQPPRPALLDVQSLDPQAVLLLDTFFLVLVHHGSVVHQWRKAGFAELPEQGAFRQATWSAQLLCACMCLMKP